ncbi:hypothetical protein HMPREF1425_01326 [Helicobacter pylori GAM71Ai]|nr:hypothetical protein HMPREF1392_00334 [Helicobacter pylori GAM101Biv]EMH34040.1 hypothetical protein HMPREF1425_01326 [Helicobacter pylori GAM71Ai]EMJ39459.1 hypothetical protein HMPREF1432_01484 [Helicobacter pylori GAMchJs114i]
MKELASSKRDSPKKNDLLGLGGFSWGCRGELFQNTPIPLVLH